MESLAMQKMIKCRTALVIDQRFFGSLASRLELKEDTTCGTMWVDGISLGFNPEWVVRLSMNNTKGVIVHEVFHCIAGHHIRRNGRDFDDWNEACDYTTNAMVLDAGFTLPEGMLFNSSYKNKGTENVYTMIQAGKSKKEDSAGNDGKQDKKEGPKSAGTDQTANGQGDDKGNNSNGPESGSAKSESKNHIGEVRDCPNATTTPEKDQIQKEWQIAIAEAAQASQGCGQMEGNLKEVVKDMLSPKVEWQEVLQRFVDMAAKNDYSYKRINPMYAQSGILLPSLYNKELPPIDVWIDTSGSISTEDKKQFVGEINDIRQHYQTTIRIVYCDTKVRHTETIEAGDDFTELNCHGGGGTRFQPAIDWSMKQDELPCVGIYLTDMDCHEKLTEPEFPVLWIDTRSSGYGMKPKFGEVVKMTPRRWRR